MSRVDRSFIDRMTIEQLRDELADELEQKFALMEAFRDLPEVAPIPAQRLLGECSTWPRDSDRGKALQRVHGSSVIPLKSEYECGAGLWALIRDALQKQSESK